MQYQIIVMAALAASTAFAGSSNTVSSTTGKETGNILITATRTQSNRKTIPGNPTVITADELAQGGFTSVPDALNKRAGIHIRNYADNPNRASVDMRGFGENSYGRVLVLLNGHRLNRPDLASINWAQIPIGNIDRIEVAPGAHSALYGDYAVGGVINIITRRGTEKPRTDISITGGSYGFNDESLTTSGDVKGTGYTASIGHQSSDGYRARSAYETWSGNLSLANDINDYLSSWIDYSYVNSRYELPGGLTEAQMKQNRRQSINPSDDAAESFHNIDFGIGLYPNANNEASIDVGFSRKDIESNMASWFSFNSWTIDTYSISPKYVWSSSPFQRDNQLTLGMDASYDDLDVDLYSDRGHTTRNGSSSVGKEDVGAYAHDKLDLLDNLFLSGGARAEQARYSITERDGSGVVQQDTSNMHHVTAYDAAMTYLPVKQAKFFARFNKLYRLPFVDEQISYQGFGSGFNKNLKPETGESYELGADIAPSKKIDLQCTLFRMDMKDEIAYAVTNFTTFAGSNFNMDKTRHQGVELSGNWQALKRLGFHANYTFQEVKFTAGANKGNDEPLVPRNMATAGCDAEVLNKLHVWTDVTYTGKQFAGSAVDNSSGTELDAYTVVDIALRYSFTCKKTQTELFAGIDNLFAEKYSPMAYGGFGSIYAYYPAPERTYKAGIKVSF